MQRAKTDQTVILYSASLDTVLSSDIRLKHNIALLGQLDNGLGLYRFSYNGSDKAYVGVMAQEVEAIRPDAVVRGSDGYLRVVLRSARITHAKLEDWMAVGREDSGNDPRHRRAAMNLIRLCSLSHRHVLCTYGAGAVQHARQRLLCHHATDQR